MKNARDERTRANGRPPHRPRAAVFTRCELERDAHRVDVKFTEIRGTRKENSAAIFKYALLVSALALEWKMYKFLHVRRKWLVQYHIQCCDRDIIRIRSRLLTLKSAFSDWKIERERRFDTRLPPDEIIQQINISQIRAIPAKWMNAHINLLSYVARCRVFSTRKNDSVSRFSSRWVHKCIPCGD